ncbi:MAG: hypothetical protein Q9172_003918 [Xanthocarpia lactea]
MFPGEKDPTGGKYLRVYRYPDCITAYTVADPAHWSESELRIWLERRGRLPSGKASREELLERVYANLRPPNK